MGFKKISHTFTCLSEGKLIITKHVDALEQGAHQFERQAVSLKRKFWWQNLKVG